MVRYGRQLADFYCCLGVIKSDSLFKFWKKAIWA